MAARQAPAVNRAVAPDTDGSAATARFAAMPLADLLGELGASESGLGAATAAEALARVGANRIESAGRAGLLIDFLRRFGNPLVLILLFAAAISAFTGDAASFGIIAAIVLMSVVLDVMQERQAQNAAAQLREQVSLTANALRDGRVAEVPAAEIVPGDIVLLAAGDMVPADARLIELRDLYVDEALLTGEAFPAEKELAPPVGEAGAFPRNLVFMGSSVVSGTAKALVVATGGRRSSARLRAHCAGRRRRPRSRSASRISA